MEFVQSLLGSLPSPSSAKASSAVAFGELLVDLLWAVDTELDDICAGASAVLTSADQGNAVVVNGEDAVAAVARVAKVKQTGEADRKTLAGLAQQLVVCISYYKSIITAGQLSFRPSEL